MKKLQKRMLALVLSAVMVFGLGITAAAEPYFDESDMIRYTSSKDSTGYGYGFYIGGLTKKSKITNVKSSKPAVLKYVGWEMHSNETTVYNAEGTPTVSTDYYAYLNVNMGIGKAKLSFKADKKSFSRNLQVLAYANPIKAITLDGVNSGKTFASKYKTMNYTNFKTTKALSNPKLTVTPANGWKITGMYYSFYQSDSSETDYTYNSNYGSISYRTPRSAKTTWKVPVTFAAGKYAYMYVTLVNEKTKGSLSCYIYLNN